MKFKTEKAFFSSSQNGDKRPANQDDLLYCQSGYAPSCVLRWRYNTKLLYFNG